MKHQPLHIWGSNLKGQRTVNLKRVQTRLLRDTTKRRKTSYQRVVNELVIAARKDLANAKAACERCKERGKVFRCPSCPMEVLSNIRSVIDEN